jgi:hypothetical protein
MPVSGLEIPFRRVRARLVAGVLTGGVLTSSAPTSYGMYRTTEDARALLRAAKEIHSERHGAQTFTRGTHLPLEEARRRTALGANTMRYHDVIEEMESEGAIEWAASARYARGDKHYVITQRGLEMLTVLDDG